MRNPLHNAVLLVRGLHSAPGVERLAHFRLDALLLFGQLQDVVDHGERYDDGAVLIART